MKKQARAEGKVKRDEEEENEAQNKLQEHGVLLIFRFELENVTCVSMSVLSLEKWMPCERTLMTIDPKTELVTPYSNPSPIEIESDAMTAKDVIKNLEIVRDQKRVYGFSLCFGQAFHSSEDMLTPLLETLEELGHD